MKTLSNSDYVITLDNGVITRVQIDASAAPFWYGAEIDEDTKTEVLNAIDKLEEEEDENL